MPGAGKACSVASEGRSVPISDSPASVTHQQGAGPTRHPDQVTVSVSVSQMHCRERLCGPTAPLPTLCPWAEGASWANAGEGQAQHRREQGRSAWFDSDNRPRENRPLQPVGLFQGRLVPKAHLVTSGDIFGCHTGEGRERAAGIQWGVLG